MPKTAKQNLPVFTQWGNPVLHRPAKQFPRNRIGAASFRKLTQKMFRQIAGVGVGLAANQTGLSLRLAVIHIPPSKRRGGLKPVPPTVLINPKITYCSKDKVGGWEGCLSCAGPRFWVERSRSIRTEYVNEFNKKMARRVDGWEARVFQHEIDHLNGIVCGERTAIRSGKVMPRAIISNNWYQKHLKQTP